MSGELANAMFHEEPAGTFSEGYIFRSPPDLSEARRDPAVGYWHCDLDGDQLTWSDKVYELFGLPAGTPIGRNEAVAQYSEHSKDALERVRNFGLNRNFGFILDAEIKPEGSDERWIRVIAVPIVADGRVVALHGLKRAL